MKRFLAVVVLSLVVVQLCLLPIAVTATLRGCPSVATLPATNITDSTATLNGSVTVPDPVLIQTTGNIIMKDRVSLASLQYVGGITQTSVSFQYGIMPGVYTNETPATSIIMSRAVTANLSGLAPCTTYYARVKLQGWTQSQLFYRYGDSIKGAGVGLDYKNLQRLFNQPGPESCPDSYEGNEISFQTTGCQPFIGTGSHGSSFSGTTTTQPVGLPNIVTQSASLSARSVTPGAPVTVTADIINKSAVNGNKKVTLYVNGQVETTQGVTVNSGGSSKLTFNVSRSEPGDYNVYVDGVPAGSFKVEMVTEPNTILIFSATLVALAFLIGVVMIWRRQRAVPS